MKKMLFAVVPIILFHHIMALACFSAPSVPSAPPASASRGALAAAGVGLPPVLAHTRSDFETMAELKAALRDTGLETSNLMVAIDFTASNEDTGAQTFQGKKLHWLDPEGRILNPYQWALTVIGRTLERYDDDKDIPAFGFGDTTTKDKNVFSLKPLPHYQLQSGVNPIYYRENRTQAYLQTAVPCQGFAEVFTYYAQAAQHVSLSGGTSFTPFIRAAMAYSQSKPREHITAIILTDGAVSNLADNMQALVDASQFPISFIIIGLGDGPFGAMETADDFPGRRFDNLQFVNFFDVMAKAGGNIQNQEEAFARKALGELPRQYQAMQQLGML